MAAHRVKLLFGLAELPLAAELHGNMSQTGRLQALDSFRKVSLHVIRAVNLSCPVLSQHAWRPKQKALPGFQSNCELRMPTHS